MVLLPLLHSGFLIITALLSALDSHPLILHLASTYMTLCTYDFCWIHECNSDWATQTAIPQAKQDAMLGCLLHYNLNKSFLMWYLRNNYTGAYHEVSLITDTLRTHKVDNSLIDKYIRIMLTGCQNHFIADTMHANALLHWRLHNHPSKDKKPPQAQVLATMNKEDQNNFVISLPHWVARDTPHLFFTPQHVLVKSGKNECHIFDAS
jgi:hypothetical protein